MSEAEEREPIKITVIDPDAPVRFLRVRRGDEELAMIPWDEAEQIAAAVQEYNDDRRAEE